MEKFNVILASGSPRRKELLRLIFSEFEVLPSPFDEESLKMGDFTPKRWWKTLSRCKAEAVYNTIRNQNTNSINPLVIGGDTVVVSPEGEVMGKPRDADDAGRMLRSLSGRCHRVITGVSLFYRQAGAEKATPFRS